MRCAAFIATMLIWFGGAAAAADDAVPYFEGGMRFDVVGVTAAPPAALVRQGSVTFLCQLDSDEVAHRLDRCLPILADTPARVARANAGGMSEQDARQTVADETAAALGAEQESRAEAEEARANLVAWHEELTRAMARLESLSDEEIDSAILASVSRFVQELSGGSCTVDLQQLSALEDRFVVPGLFELSAAEYLLAVAMGQEASGSRLAGVLGAGRWLVDPENPPSGYYDEVYFTMAIDRVRESGDAELADMAQQAANTTKIILTNRVEYRSEALLQSDVVKTDLEAQTFTVVEGCQ